MRDQSAKLGLRWGSSLQDLRPRPNRLADQILSNYRAARLAEVGADEILALLLPS